MTISPELTKEQASIIDHLLAICQDSKKVVCIGIIKCIENKMPATDLFREIREMVRLNPNEMISILGRKLMEKIQLQEFKCSDTMPAQYQMNEDLLSTLMIVKRDFENSNGVIPLHKATRLLVNSIVERATQKA